METHKLYRDDPYLTENEAHIVSIADNRIELDQTVFYGEAGGQIGDTGTVAGIRIVDTQHAGGKPLFRSDAPVINVQTTIMHIADEQGATLSPGTTVQVQIDWERRYRIMRMHSAAHFVYHYTRKFCGSEGTQKIFGTLKGCRISAESARFDFPARKRLDQSDIQHIQDAANTLIIRDLDIHYEPDATEPDLRWWVCGEVEMYCGGTHVRNTREIGEIVVKRRSQGSGLERVYLELQR